MKLILTATLLSIISGLISGQKDEQQQPIIRYMVKGDGAKKAALAVGGNVVLDIPKRGITALEFDDIGMVEALKTKANKSGFQIEEDRVREIIPTIPSNGQGRRLAESIPWGIEKTYERNGVVDVPNSAYFPNSAANPVCILDTGYDLDHPDLPNDAEGTTNNWTNDCDGHGSHVAGTIGAIGGNNEGVVGVWPGAPDMKIAKGFGRFLFLPCSFTYSSGLIGAAEDCAELGAKVISMSLGSTVYSQFEDDEFQDLYDEGILSIAAAGNLGDTTYGYPASYDSVMSVGATDVNDDIAYFSQYNDQVEISAPGVDVDSTVDGGGYDSYYGTSMACPHVAGVATVLWSKVPSATNAQIRDALNAGAVDKGLPGRDDFYGNGILNYWNSLDYLGGGVPTVSPAPTEATASPTPCSASNFQLTLNTDDYGSETTWTLRNTDISTEVQSGGPYTAGIQETIVENICIIDGCYRFQIFDSYGDGICCGYGSGSYEIIVDGVVEQSSDGDFGSSETTTFCTSSGTCEDSGLLLNGIATCAQAAGAGKCTVAAVGSHCPNSCGQCAQYECEDSQAPFEVGGNSGITCAIIAGQNSDIIAQACSLDSIGSTCRATCQFC